MQLRLHCGLIVAELAAFFREIERVRERINEDAAGLTIDHPGKQRAQFRIILRQWQVWPDLCRRVAEPHGRDVAGDDERVWLAVRGADPHSRIESIGETVFE